MPRPPQPNPHTQHLRPSVFASLAGAFKTLAEPPVPLHLGDTFRSPPAAAQWSEVVQHLPKNPYAYASPEGLEELRAAVAERLARKGLPGLTSANVLPTSGGTAALATLVHTWLQPGDEVLVFAPFWPLIRGMIHAAGAVPVEVPVYEGLRQGLALRDIVAPYLSPRTAALYVTSPNNPCGTVLTPAQSGDVAQLATALDLWVIADEAYHDFVYGGAQHTFIASLPGMAARTATVLTASKSYALAGTRVGFLVGDTAWLDTARRVATHLLYQLPIVCQIAALRAITHGEPWIAETRDLYAEAAKRTAATLQARFAPAQGGGYVFVDLREELRGQPILDYVRGLLHEGVCISPGDVFGTAYADWARVCYTAVPLDQLDSGLQRLNRSLERLRSARA